MCKLYKITCQLEMRLYLQNYYVVYHVAQTPLLLKITSQNLSL